MNNASEQPSPVFRLYLRPIVGSYKAACVIHDVANDAQSWINRLAYRNAMVCVHNVTGVNRYAFMEFILFAWYGERPQPEALVHEIEQQLDEMFDKSLTVPNRSNYFTPLDRALFDYSDNGDSEYRYCKTTLSTSFAPVYESLSSLGQMARHQIAVTQLQQKHCGHGGAASASELSGYLWRCPNQMSIDDLLCAEVVAYWFDSTNCHTSLVSARIQGKHYATMAQLSKITGSFFIGTLGKTISNEILTTDSFYVINDAGFRADFQHLKKRAEMAHAWAGPLAARLNDLYFQCIQPGISQAELRDKRLRLGLDAFESLTDWKANRVRIPIEVLDAV